MGYIHIFPNEATPVIPNERSERRDPLKKPTPQGVSTIFPFNF
jgi:hypothetical protein